MKIILVDDERLALQHMASLLPWDRLGYTVAATATNGRSALRLCEELRPQLMIVDIRMPVMDGLELIQAVSRQGLGVKFIVMSAYQDFEYARKAISLGSVSSYLVKHEVDGEKLLLELDKAKAAWNADEEQRRLRRSERLKELVMGANEPTLSREIVKAPYGMALIRGDVPFSPVPSVSDIPEAVPGSRLDPETPALFETDGCWQPAGQFPVDAGQTVVLFSPRNRTAPVTPAPLRESFRELMLSCRERVNAEADRSCSIYYTCVTDGRTSLPASYNKIHNAMLHAVFYGTQAVVCADELPLPNRAEPSYVSNPCFHAVIEGLEQHDAAQIESAVTNLFAGFSRPPWDLRGLLYMIRGMTALVNERRARRGMIGIDPFDGRSCKPVFCLPGIRTRFLELFGELCADADEGKRISGKLQKALRYMHAHYHEDLSIDTVSHATEISASYLHQLFKRELGRTFLDYLTEHRIHQAKRILRQGDAKMTEVATSVGYRSPQHFSQVFKKMTGTLPHQYRSDAYPS